MNNEKFHQWLLANRDIQNISFREATAIIKLLGAAYEIGKNDATIRPEWWYPADDYESSSEDPIGIMIDADGGKIVELHGAAIVRKRFFVMLPSHENDDGACKEFDSMQEAQAAVDAWREANKSAEGGTE